VTRWTAAAANTWSVARPLPLGCNFIPSTAVNVLEMWQAATFDVATIDRELGLAAGLGMNAVRVFLHDLLWTDPAGMIARFDTFLALADRHGIVVMPVLFESCWDAMPVAGPQLPPRPGVHNSRWVQSPGMAALTDVDHRSRLEAYVGGVVAAFARDPRVMAWDVWNEPDNGPEIARGDVAGLQAKAALVMPLLDAAFGWIRAAGATQPLTSGVWSGDWSSPARLTPIQACQLDQSDFTTFHNYDGASDFIRRVDWLAALGRPVMCTEYMARPRGSTFAAILPEARRRGVGMFNWGLVRGATQTHLPWDSWQTPYLGPAPEPWFHDIFDPNGTLHDPADAALFQARDASEPRRLAGSPTDA